MEVEVSQPRPKVETAAVVNFAGILPTSDYQRLEIWNNLKNFLSGINGLADYLTNLDLRACTFQHEKSR